jgi:oxalate decarboxylase/phosphoglucose isomerase-like protein (cupin superfamily)
MYPEMTTEEVFYVITSIKEYFQTYVNPKSYTVDGKPGILHAVNDLQFDTRRIFYIDSLDEQTIGKKRGFHANMNLNECLIVQSGSIQVDLTNCMNESRTYTLEKGDVFYIPKQYWIEYTIVKANTVILVLADQTISDTKSVYAKEEFLQVSM